MDTVIAIGVLSKILGFGISTWDAFKTPGFDDKDLSALRAFLDAGGGVLGAAMSPKESEAAAQHLALITRAFGQAFGRHWAFNKEFVPTGKFRAFMSKEQKQRATEITARTSYAAQKLLKPGELPVGTQELSLISSLAGSPLNTPYYRALWDAFSNPNLSDEQAGEPPLLDLTSNTRREFERNFLIAYWEGLASSTNRGVVSYIEGLEKYRTQVIRELLLKDLSTWNERHLFGNTERSNPPPSYGLPFMSLEAMYVEPNGKIEGSSEASAPILSLIVQALRQSKRKVIFVKADFGSGKSLTARILAYRLATTLLSTQQGTSLDQEFPVFIRCADDFPSEGAFELAPTVRRAWKRQAATFNLDLKTSDSALGLPEDEQRTTYILDGLDEIALGDRRLDALMQRLHDEQTDLHRFIVFSRPGALPSDHKLKDSIVIELLPFAIHDTDMAPGGQVREWLEKWNKVGGRETPLLPEHLVAQGLLEIAKTPILLFMLAQSWDDISNTDSPKSLAEIYEGFFRHIARGKHALDREANNNVFEASNHLLDKLKSLNELGADASAPDAMLWLMSRVAWEATKLEQRDPSEPLTTRDVDRLLEDELGLRPSSELISTIRMGLLLAMQADLRAGADHILFGHKSFREFLVARFWVDQVRKIALVDSREAAELERALYGGRLLANDKHLNFLIDMLGRLTDNERSRIAKWAQSCFESEELFFRTRKGRPSEILLDDLRATLREAALAIGCESGCIEVRKPSTLLSLCAWFVAAEKYVKILAQGSVLRGTSLRNVRLFYSTFEEADFDDVDLSDSMFGECVFSGAHFDEAEFEISEFEWCPFDGARFNGCRITSRFNECSFCSSSFEGCVLEGSEFLGCDFKKSLFVDVGMIGVSFPRCDFGGARVVGCKLDGVDFRGLDLSSVVFENTSYTGDVTWPDGFDLSVHPGLYCID